MTLAARLSLFFLVALAVVLGGFSASLYGLARSHLFRQLEERSTAALDTLTVVVEVEQGALEWDTHQRLLLFNAENAGGPMVWGVFDEAGRLVDGPKEAGALFAGRTEPLHAGEPGREDVTWKGATWRLTRRTLGPDSFGERAAAEGLPPEGEPQKKRYDALVLAVGVPLDPVHGTLRTLALVLTAIALTLWATAALGGRWLCRRALVPLTRMAQTARSITAAELSRRLPATDTKDELEDLGRAFNDLLERIQDSYERQQRFTGEASHQLRTPLTAMLGQIEVALRRERPVEEYRRVLGSVQKQAVQLRHIVEMLLFLARANAEAKLPELEPFDLCSWLANHLPSWERHPRWQDLRYEAGTEKPLEVTAHPALLGQAVDNLLDNACKYSTTGSPIVLRTWRQGAEVCLAVEDQGLGIAPEELPHVFDPFFRSPEVRRHGIGGIGLGLAVTNRIVLALGGRLEVSSQAGRGSRFVIVLPALLTSR
jgi:signal transduction histidine kinase